MVPDPENPPDHRSHAKETTDRDELRTISFRLREIHRLLSIRVEQENRRLEADGIDRVPNTRFLDEEDTADTDIKE